MTYFRILVCLLLLTGLVALSTSSANTQEPIIAIGPAQYDDPPPAQPPPYEQQQQQQHPHTSQSQPQQGPSTAGTEVSHRVSITVNGKSFKVKESTRARLANFLKDYEVAGKVGGLFQGLVSLLVALDLLNPEDIPSGISISIGNEKEVMMAVNAPRILGDAWLSEATSALEFEALRANQAQDLQGAAMLRYVRDILQSKKTIGYDAKKHNLVLPEFADSNIAAPPQRFAAGLTYADRSAVRGLSQMLHQPYAKWTSLRQVTDSVGTYYFMHPSDLWAWNRALLRLSPAMKDALRQQFERHEQRYDEYTWQLWYMFRRFLDHEEWSRPFHSMGNVISDIRIRVITEGYVLDPGGPYSASVECTYGKTAMEGELRQLPPSGATLLESHAGWRTGHPGSWVFILRNSTPVRVGVTLEVACL